jgi:hypothetical protein
LRKNDLDKPSTTLGTVNAVIVAKKPQVLITLSPALNLVLAIETTYFQHAAVAIQPRQANKWNLGTKDKNFIVKYAIRKLISGYLKKFLPIAFKTLTQ